MTPLLTLDVPRPDSTVGLARSVMEDKLSQLDQEFLGVGPDAPVSEVIKQMKAAGLGCALILDRGELVGIFTERDLLNKLTGKTAHPQSIPVRDLMSANPEVLRGT